MDWPNISIPDRFLEMGVTPSQWTDWRWQISRAVRNEKQLQACLGIDTTTKEEVRKIITNEYERATDSMFVTPHLLSLINTENSHDPVALQHIPNASELQRDKYKYESVWEKDTDFLDGKNRMLQQKYPDIVVLRMANVCMSFCRFCFEKKRTLRRDVPTCSTPKQFDRAVDMIKKLKSVRQILISGGDPLVLSDEILKQRLKTLLDISHITHIRIGTRALLHNPYRITPEFADILSELQKQYAFQIVNPTKQISIGTHFNHSNELSLPTINAIRRLQSGGIKIYNQTVLLKGINDDASIISSLFEKLLSENISLHYLFHAMPVPRTEHFRTSVRKGQKIMHELRNMKKFRSQLPEYVIPHETGKQIAESMNKEFFESTVNEKGRQIPVIKFKSHITEKWEIYPDGHDNN